MIIYTYQWWKMVYCPLVTKPWSIEVTIWRSGSTRVDQSSRGAIQLHKWLFHQQKWLLDIGKYLKTTWNISRKWTFDWVLEPKFRGTKRRHISDDFDSDLAKREELLWSMWAVLFGLPRCSQMSREFCHVKAGKFGCDLWPATCLDAQNQNFSFFGAVSYPRIFLVVSYLFDWGRAGHARPQARLYHWAKSQQNDGRFQGDLNGILGVI